MSKITSDTRRGTFKAELWILLLCLLWIAIAVLLFLLARLAIERVLPVLHPFDDLDALAATARQAIVQPSAVSQALLTDLPQQVSAFFDAWVARVREGQLIAVLCGIAFSGMLILLLAVPRQSRSAAVVPAVPPAVSVSSTMREFMENSVLHRVWPTALMFISVVSSGPMLDAANGDVRAFASAVLSAHETVRLPQGPGLDAALADLGSAEARLRVAFAVHESWAFLKAFCLGLFGAFLAQDLLAPSFTGFLRRGQKRRSHRP